MFSGEATPNLKLPQWQPKDHPDFLTDINDAFKSIDARAGSDTEEWGQLPTQVSDLTDIVTSLNEDRTTMIGEIEAINVALGNLRTESAKIEPIQKQVLGLQEIAKRQSDAIQELITLTSIRKSHSGTLHLSDDLGNTATIEQIAVLNGIVRVLATFSNVTIATNKITLKVADSEIAGAMNNIGLAGKNFTLFGLNTVPLLDENANIVGDAYIQNFSDTEISLSINAIQPGVPKRLLGYIEGQVLINDN